MFFKPFLIRLRLNMVWTAAFLSSKIIGRLKKKYTTFRVKVSQSGLGGTYTQYNKPPSYSIMLELESGNARYDPPTVVSGSDDVSEKPVTDTRRRGNIYIHSSASRTI